MDSESAIIRKYHKSHWKTFFATRTSRKTPTNIQQTPANTRKRPQNQKRGNFCFPIRGSVFFSVFLLDGLTRSVKIHTQAMWLCNQYAWLKGRILAWRCNGGTQETWIYMHSTWFSLIRHDFQQHAVNDMIFVWNDMKSWTPRKILSREDQGYNYSPRVSPRLWPCAGHSAVAVVDRANAGCRQAWTTWQRANKVVEISHKQWESNGKYENIWK